MTAKPYGPMAPDGSQFITLTDGNGNLVTSIAPSGAAGGDLTGTYPNPTLTTPISGVHVFTGNLGLGTNVTTDSLLCVNANTAALPAAINGTLIHVGNVDATNSRILIENSSSLTPILCGRSTGGTFATPSATTAGTILLSLGGLGFTNALTTAANAAINFNANTLWSASNADTYIEFGTTPTSSTTRVARMRIQQSGGVSIGATSIAADPGTGALNLDGVLTSSAAVATPAGGSTSARHLFGTTSGFGIYYGSGAPTVSAAQGSLYLRSDGSSTSTRLYVNTNGTTGWTNVTTAA